MSTQTYSTSETHDSGRPLTRSERITAELEAGILRGDLTPGQKLDEVMIAQRYNVSRTPVREALRALAVSGLIVHEPRIGAIVARPTVSNVVELFELVGEMEGVAIRLACERMTDVHSSRIRAAYLACRRDATSEQADVYLAANDVFHKAIHEAAENRMLSAQIEQLSRRLGPYRRFITFLPGRRDSAEREHEILAEALFAGDGARAASAMRDHVKVLAEDSLLLARSLQL